MEAKVAAVSMKNVTKTFGSVVANDKVNLDIYKGENDIAAGRVHSTGDVRDAVAAELGL